jgi:hypothetical protein
MRTAKEEARRLIEQCLGAADNEAAATLQLRVLLATGRLSSVLEVPAIERSKFEYQIPGVGIADLALFHPGGGLTLVEAKGPEVCRAIAAGIGQLFMYEAGVRQQLARNGTPPPFVNRVLCAPVTAEWAFPVWQACQIAGVRFVTLQTLGKLKEAAAVDLEALEG